MPDNQCNVYLSTMKFGWEKQKCIDSLHWPQSKVKRSDTATVAQQEQEFKAKSDHANL